MNKGLRKIYDEVGQATGLRINEQTDTLMGEAGGFHLKVDMTNNNYMVYASVRKNGQLPDKELLKSICKANKGMMSLGVQGNYVIATVRGMTTKKVIAYLINAIKALTEAFNMYGFEDVCESCGKPHTNIGSYCVSGSVSFLCDECYTQVTQSLQQSEVEMSNTKESVVAGVVGAFLGSVIGVITIIILGQLGYVAVISGLVMGVCTVKGYEMLGKKMSTKGIIICSIVMIIMTYFGEKLDWMITMMTEADFSLSEASFYFWDILEYADATSSFIGDLALVYLFTAGGAVPTILNVIKARKQAFTSYQIG